MVASRPIVPIIEYLAPECKTSENVKRGMIFAFLIDGVGLGHFPEPLTQALVPGARGRHACSEAIPKVNFIRMRCVPGPVWAPCDRLRRPTPHGWVWARLPRPCHPHLVSRGSGVSAGHAADKLRQRVEMMGTENS